MRKSYVQVQMPDGSWRLVDKDTRPPTVDAPYFMPDLSVAAVSPIDGTVLSSRSVRREHNRRHDVIDVGNDPSLHRPIREIEPQGVRESIQQAMQQLGMM